jgi:S1-C subfamily serine protease
MYIHCCGVVTHFQVMQVLKSAEENHIDFFEESWSQFDANIKKGNFGLQFFDEANDLL